MYSNICIFKETKKINGIKINKQFYYLGNKLFDNISEHFDNNLNDNQTYTTYDRYLTSYLIKQLGLINNYNIEKLNYIG